MSKKERAEDSPQVPDEQAFMPSVDFREMEQIVVALHKAYRGETLDPAEQAHVARYPLFPGNLLEIHMESGAVETATILDVPQLRGTQVSEGWIVPATVKARRERGTDKLPCLWTRNS